MCVFFCCNIAGDEKLLHLQVLVQMKDNLYAKPDREGLWICDLCLKLSYDLPCLIRRDLLLHDSIGNIGETTPISAIVAH